MFKLILGLMQYTSGHSNSQVQEYYKSCKFTCSKFFIIYYVYKISLVQRMTGNGHSTILGCRNLLLSNVGQCHMAFLIRSIISASTTSIATFRCCKNIMYCIKTVWLVFEILKCHPWKKNSTVLYFLSPIQ
jgi:hypothetical protein